MLLNVQYKKKRCFAIFSAASRKKKSEDEAENGIKKMIKKSQIWRNLRLLVLLSKGMRRSWPFFPWKNLEGKNHLIFLTLFIILKTPSNFIDKGDKKLRTWIMRKYLLVHNVVGFVSNLHEFIKHLSAIFLFLLLREIEIYGRVLAFYDVIISPSTSLVRFLLQRTIKRGKRQRSELFKVFIPLSRMTFYGKVSSYALFFFFRRFVMYVNELQKKMLRWIVDEKKRVF